MIERAGPRIIGAVVLDVLAIIAFVLLGRDTHDGGFALDDVLRTAAPFLIALALAWMIGRAWRAPNAPRTGVRVGPTTALLGLALRRTVFGDGTALTFVLVATLFLSGFIIGWRVLGVAARSRRGSADVVSGSSTSRPV